MTTCSFELGCGKGEYSVGLAERYPNKKISLELILKELVLAWCKTVEDRFTMLLFELKSN
jgi:tRNA G46 methylase TrmB